MFTLKDLKVILLVELAFLTCLMVCVHIYIAQGVKTDVTTAYTANSFLSNCFNRFFGISNVNGRPEQNRLGLFLTWLISILLILKTFSFIRGPQHIAFKIGLFVHCAAGCSFIFLLAILRNVPNSILSHTWVALTAATIIVETWMGYVVSDIYRQYLIKMGYLPDDTPEIEELEMFCNDSGANAELI